MQELPGLGPNMYQFVAGQLTANGGVVCTKAAPNVVNITLTSFIWMTCIDGYFATFSWILGMQLHGLRETSGRLRQDNAPQMMATLI